MPSILRIDTSPRVADSHSRAIADLVEKAFMSGDSAYKVTRRDLASMEIPALSQAAITGFFSPKDGLSEELQQATALSDELIAELQGADTLLISAPLYNFGAPSSLKAWIDQIVRVNETFSFDGSSFGGLVRAKRAILALSYGAQGYAPGAEMSAANFLEPYLAFVLKFLGVEDVQVFRIEGTSVLAEEELGQAKEALEADINAAFGA
ncbi:MAG: FMN-dependent NADH-azoreductase [Oceanobacter sp.]